MSSGPLTVAWVSDFPVEWLDDPPTQVRALPKGHPTTWQRVLFGEFKNRGDLKLHVICLRKQIEQDFSFERSGVTFHVLKVRGIRSAMGYWPDTLAIRRALTKIGPDLVHAWGTERAAGLIAQRLGVPHLITMQGILGWIGETTRLSPYFRVMVHFERYTLRRAKVATVESRFGLNYLKARYPRLSLKQVEHAPAGIFHEVVRQPSSLPLRFLNVGAPGMIKGTDILLGALDRLKKEIDFQLTIIGKPYDEFRPDLDRALKSDLGSRIKLREACSSAEIADELARCTMVILPTRADNSPNSVKEAVVAGVPVVASEVGGIPDYVTRGKNGDLFRPGDLEDCVRAIRATCVHPLFGKGLVEAAALAEKRIYLSPQTMSRRFREAYDLTLRLFGTTNPNRPEIEFA